MKTDDDPKRQPGHRSQLTHPVTWLYFALLASLFSACQLAAAPEPEVVDLQVLLVNSELVAGPNRLTVALQNQDGSLVHEADVQFQYFDLSNPDEPLTEMTSQAVPIQSADGRVTLFTDTRNFARPGAWGIVVRTSLPDGATSEQNIALTIQEDSASTLPGQLAPSVQTPTSDTVSGDLALISTAENPDPSLYTISLEDALSNGKPTLLYFATPQYCRTQVCGPGYDELTTLLRDLDGFFNTIHVEIYEDLVDPGATGWQLVPAMNAFGLTTEPWLYVIDASGEVVFRVEGLFTAEEMKETLSALFPG